MRALLCGAATAENERLLEMNEGLAEYTGLVLAGYGKPSLDTRAALRLEQEQASGTFARSFAYATGPAYGLLLEQYGPGWRRSLTAKASLSDLLAHALPPSHEIQVLTGTALVGYGESRVIADEVEREQPREERTAAFRKAFVDGPILELPVASQFGFSFDPNGVESLPGIGQVFESTKIADEWGILQVQSGGVLLRRPEAVFTGVVVRAPASPAGDTVAGDGWTLKLNAGWRVAPGARHGDWKVVRAGTTGEAH
jgi:hypothetical protein